MERNPNDRSSKIMRLVELIEHINATIQTHRGDPTPDILVIEQYEDRRSELLNELAELLRPLGVALEWKTLTQAA
jgi:hypothetical protein